MSVDGWSLPRATEPVTTFAVNGAAFEVVEYPLPRPDVGKVFWQREHSESSGFRCLSSNVSPLYPGGLLEISRSGDSSAVDAGRNSWFVPDPALHADLPDEDRRFRVIGNRDASAFLSSGATDFHRLDRAVRAISGRALWESGRILDWGVGCGRVARHCPKQAAGRFAGCDIDRDNVDWCAGHLPGTYIASPLEPPLPFPAASFDVVYGISVFTHLKQPLQFRWLEELRRIAAPGALVLTTIHGETALEYSGRPSAEYLAAMSAIRWKGLLVTGTNTQLDGFVDRPSEYVNVFHSEAYVRRRWGEYFRILHVLPGYLNTQDLVVMQRG